jgi:Mlc titration factor MtfA (ptsG expression regulator)
MVAAYSAAAVRTVDCSRLRERQQCPQCDPEISMNWLERQRIRFTLSHHPLPHELWNGLMHQARVFHGLSAVQRAHLRELSTLFLHRKSFSGSLGLEVTMEMAVAVAAQACLLILELGLDYYDGWREIIVYPAAFKVSRDVADDAGVISHEEQILGGESWLRGPVVLAWDAAAAELAGDRPGRNVVVHEFAHKLDALNGSANGMPPLHATMVREHWTQAFSEAFDGLQQALQHHHSAAIDAYAATSPAEFFAVSSEYVFAAPGVLRRDFPEVYRQLALFYRQDPVSRLTA